MQATALETILGKHLWFRCFDNGGTSMDRYTVVFNQQTQSRDGFFDCLGMGAVPAYCSWHEVASLNNDFLAGDGSHLGDEVRLHTLPLDCRKLVYAEIKSYLEHMPSGDEITEDFKRQVFMCRYPALPTCECAINEDDYAYDPFGTYFSVLMAACNVVQCAHGDVPAEIGYTAAACGACDMITEDKEGGMDMTELADQPHEVQQDFLLYMSTQFDLIKAFGLGY